MPKETIKNRKHTIFISLTVLLIFFVALVTTMVLVFGYPKSDVQPTVILDKPNITSEKLDEVKAGKEATPSFDTITSEMDISDWLTYRNKDFGFELRYPPDSVIETQEDLNYSYVNLHNNVTAGDAPSGIKPKEYYLQMFLFDKDVGHNIWQPCRKLLLDQVVVALAGQEIYRGEGIAGLTGYGKQFALCSDAPQKQFYIEATENHTEGPIVNKILDTFKFIESSTDYP